MVFKVICFFLCYLPVNIPTSPSASSCYPSTYVCAVACAPSKSNLSCYCHCLDTIVPGILTTSSHSSISSSTERPYSPFSERPLFSSSRRTPPPPPNSPPKFCPSLPPPRGGNTNFITKAVADVFLWDNEPPYSGNSQWTGSYGRSSPRSPTQI